MKPIYSGKVREIYDISQDRLVIVTTDRISAFDHILPVPIKNKGVVLNRLSNFWFDRTGDIVKNHIISDEVEDMPDYFHDDFFRNRTVMVEKLDMFPFEFIARGYLFGNMWKAYERGEVFCGYELPEGYKLAQKLDRPIITPAIKHDRGHDEYVAMGQVESRLGRERVREIVDICLRLYDTCSRYAFSKGLIIADAKFEFGQDRKGSLVLADEIFTPDASRFWDAADYEIGVSPASYDKQLLRDWLWDNRADGEFQMDQIPENILEQTRQIYQECLDRLVPGGTVGPGPVDGMPL